METSLNRRGFLERAAGVAAGAVAVGVSTPVWGAEPAPAAAATKPGVAGIGLQLYTVRELVDQNLDQALESVAKVGYKVIEFAGYGGRTPEQIRATLDRLKLTAPSSHISLATLRTDLDTQIHIAETIGHQYITVPSLPATPTTADGWKKVADEFNTIATKLKARKIGLAFHSHRDEFFDVGGGKKGMDLFITGTDPSLVTFEIDLGWARVAGQNPSDWFSRYAGRIKMWHVKDILALQAAQDTQTERFKTMAAAPPAPAAATAAAPAAAPPAPGGAAPAAGAPRGGGAPGGGQRTGGAGGGGRAGGAPAVTGGPVPIGAGEIDYKPIFEQWKTSGLEHFFVEQDGAANWPGGSLVAIATSHRNLVNLLS
ncbi:MAG: sugar phosphate isomerase/epimerase [Vicinamibacterales bacterium]